LVGSNAMSSCNATIVSPSLHTRSLLVGCASFGSALRSASRLRRTRCIDTPAAIKSLAAFTATRSTNV
jgi:hypothetical protein